MLPSMRDGRVDLAPAGRAGRRGIATLLVEGGASVITAMMRERRGSTGVSIAPIVIGEGIEAVGDLDILRLRDAVTFGRAAFSQLGPDVIFEDGELEPRSYGDA